jgi:predicted Zn-dependent peptidase
MKKLTRFREFQSCVPQRGVRLCALENERYKTVRAQVILYEPIQEFTATENALLAKVLSHGSVNHPSRRALARACEELYGATLSVGASRIGDVQTIVGSVDFPADRYLPKGAKELEGALGLLAEVLTQPATASEGQQCVLRAETVEQEKFQLEQELNALRDNKPSWAARLATERVYAGTPAGVPESGRLEDLPRIDGASLFQRHKLLLGNARVLAFVTGPVNSERALKVMADKLLLPTGKRPVPPPPVILDHRSRAKSFNVAEQSEQAHLVAAWTGAGIYGTPEFSATLVAETIFGGFSMSRLFKVVREQHGLAYAVHSILHRSRGVITAQAAVAPAQAERAMKLMRSEMVRLQDKGFSDEEFSAAKASLVEGHRAMLDSVTARASDLTFQTVMGFRKSPETQLRELKRVTPAQVRAALKGLRPHTLFRLG